MQGMIHSVRFHEGKVLYSNAFVETARMRFERELGEPFFTRIGELYSGWGLAKAILTIPQRQTAGPITSEMEASPVNTAMVLTPSGKFFALNEGGAPFELELDWNGAIKRLVGFETKSGRLDFPVSAHPKVDRATGEIFFHGYSLLSSKAFLRTGRLGADGKVKAWFKVDVPSAGFNHDMALTGKYAVLFDGSARFTPQQMVQDKPVFSWDGNFTTRVALVPRDATEAHEVRWFDSPQVTLPLIPPPPSPPKPHGAPTASKGVRTTSQSHPLCLATTIGLCASASALLTARNQYTLSSRFMWCTHCTPGTRARRW